MTQKLEDLLKDLPKPVQQHVQHLELMRQDFVANVSHELRTPLTVILGYLETLQEIKEIDPSLNDIFEKMYIQAQRMQNLVSDLLLLSTLEASQDVLTNIENINLQDLILQIVESVKMIYEAKHQHVIMDVKNNISIKGNKKELLSLFSNLVINAIKYTPDKGEIHIKANINAKKKQLLIEVADNGMGIEKKHIPRLTERFYRVDKARSRDSGGTGLGLAIVKHVLIRHGGELKIKSQPNKGSVFQCVFPI